MKDTLHKKIGVDFRPYLILGACNPKLAYEALTLEDKIGTMLPCNVIVQQHDGGAVEISAVDPVASMSAIDNPKLGKVAGQVRELLKQVVSDIVESIATAVERIQRRTDAAEKIRCSAARFAYSAVARRHGGC